MEDIEVVVGRIGKAHGVKGVVSVEPRTDEPERRFADGAVLATRTPRGDEPHGIRGEVTVDVRTDEPERRFAAGTTLRAAPPAGSASPLRSVTVSRTRWHQGVLLAHFEEIGDRNAAEAARGIVLHTTIAADEAPEDPDEYYDHQLIGLAAYDLAAGRVVIADRPGLVAPFPDEDEGAQ